MYTIKQGNCLDLIQTLPDNSVDLVLTDPPYNISRENNFGTMGRAGIDFGKWDKGADITSWIELVSPKVNKNGSIVVFNSWRNLGLLANELEKNGFVVKDLIRWVKSNPMPRNRDRRYIVDYEFAIWAVKRGAKWVFNRQSKTYDRSSIVYPLTPSSEKKYGSHPTQKPVALMKNLLLRHSNPSQLVLDPFMGGGTTGVACLETNRQFIGYELDAKYFYIAKTRLEHEKGQEAKYE